MTKDKIKIGLRIKNFRKENNTTQKELAEIIGVDRTTMSHYESDYRIPSIEMLWKIADYFEMTIDELVGRK